jgi:hypothetical protein
VRVELVQLLGQFGVEPGRGKPDHLAAAMLLRAAILVAQRFRDLR